MAYARIYSDRYDNVTLYEGDVPDNRVINVRSTDFNIDAEYEGQVAARIEDGEDAEYARERAWLALCAGGIDDMIVWEDVSDRCRLIADNGGGYTLQIGGWSHYYNGCEADVARDIREWHTTGSTNGWDGDEYESRLCDPDHEDLSNGGYRIVDLSGGLVDTIAALRESDYWCAEILVALGAGWRIRAEDSDGHDQCNDAVLGDTLHKIYGSKADAEDDADTMQHEQSDYGLSGIRYYVMEV